MRAAIFESLRACVLLCRPLTCSNSIIDETAHTNGGFACEGIFNIMLPLFGLPFVTASLPHSPQFVRALQVTDQKNGGAVRKVVDSRYGSSVLRWKQRSVPVACSLLSVACACAAI